EPRADEADAEGPALEGIVALEDAGVSVEPADHGRVERALPAVRPVDRPASRSLVEEPEAHPREAAPELGAEDVLVAHAAQEGPGGDRGLELLPRRRTLEPLAQPPVVDLPGAHPEIEALCRSARRHLPSLCHK